MNDEVAVFVDLENFRYGMLQNFGQEPDFAALVKKVKKYGRPSIMKAYADFTEHPAELKRELQVFGIESINIPVTRTVYTQQGGKQVERVKNAADMELALDAMIKAWEADKSGISKIFVLVTGDRDYVKLVTQLRNRFGQRVIIVGVPGCVARDLVTAAGEEDPIDIVRKPPSDKKKMKNEIVAMVKKGPMPLKYWSLKTIDQWSQDDRQKIAGTAKEHRDVIHELLDEGVLVRKEMEIENRGKTITIVLDEKQASKSGYST